MAHTNLTTELNQQLAMLTQQLGSKGIKVCQQELAQVQTAIAKDDPDSIKQTLSSIVEHTTREIRSLTAQTHGGTDFHFFSPEKNQVIDCTYKHQLAEGIVKMLLTLTPSLHRTKENS